jgi:hypothetical protein
MARYALIRSDDRLIAARAEALFASDVSAQSVPTREQVAAAIRRAVRTYGGTRACAAEMAAEYGEHPESAASRMRWARAVVESTNGTRPPAAGAFQQLQAA